MTDSVTEPAGGRDSSIAIACRGISKRFGTNTVVDAVDLEVHAGTIHSLVGANGAGKSTILGMISGRIGPSEGVALAFGSEIVAGKPRRARELGIATVYQELTIVPQLTSVANVFLGNEMRGPLPTTRCHGKRSFAGATFSAWPTSRARPGNPARRATEPYVATCPRGIFRTACQIASRPSLLMLCMIH